MNYVLQTFNLSKRYKNQWAVDKVNMHIEKGDIYGFVGENGSGKTTIIRLITGLISPTDGDLELFGVSDKSPDILSQRRKLGAIVETPSIYLNMSAKDNLRMQSTILGIQDEDKIRATLLEVGLNDLYDNPKHASNYSLGMRQRLGIAMALLGDPEFIILDEPMNGLDPAGIVEIRELILKLNAEKGITFLISSHILTELSLVANKYGIISKGKLLKEITSEELKKQCRPTIFIQTKEQEKLLGLLITMFSSDDFQAGRKGVRIFGNVHLNTLLQKILDADIAIDSVNCYESSIEHYYLSLIGGGRHA